MNDQLTALTTSEECIPCFIRKTYKILEDDKYSDIISWNNEGTAVVIKNPTDFAQTILPTYFKHNNLNSFIRQLNMYDFHKKKTPDGEHVYYHELFQRDKKHLLKNIRRKNTESSTLNTEKSRLGLELVRTKQDIATIINENLILKKINREALTTISSLENKMNETNLQNQTLWAQLLKYNEKEEAMKNFVPAMKREALSFPLSSIDTNAAVKAQNEQMLSKLAQTTTRIPNFTGDMTNQRGWTLLSDSFEEVAPQGFYNTQMSENIQPNKPMDKSRGSQTALKNKSYSDQHFAADLSQQIVKNMDQELQYLKKLTSSNNRPNNLSSENSPDSGLLGKRRIETDPGSYESINKLYRPDPMLTLNFLTNNYKAENGLGQDGEGGN